MKKKAVNQQHKSNGSDSRVRLGEIISVLRKHDIIKGVTPGKLRMILEDLGPTYVKIGQIMSMRSDMLPEEYCDELRKLRAEVNPLPFTQIEHTLEEEYGKPISQVFRSIEEKSLGSASMAQVHPVILKDGRRAVAKVQRPGIRNKMSQDIALMRKAAKIVQKMEISGDAIDFCSVIDQMWLVAQEEMDFLLEANNVHQLAQLNADIEYVSFPAIEDQLTTERVIVMEYVDGLRIDDLAGLEEAGYDVDEIGNKLAANYIKQVLDDGFFHADPHPGNIRVSDGKIVWLDLGMVGKLSERDRNLFRKGVLSIVEQDIIELKTAVLTLGEVKGSINHSALYNDLEGLLNKYGNMDFATMNLGEVLQQMMALCNRHGIKMPSRITMLGRGVVTIEGVLAYCCPNVSFIELAAKHLTKGLFDEINFKDEIFSKGKSFYKLGKKMADVPMHVSDLLKMLVKGQAKVNLDVTGAEEPIRQIDHMVDKLIICIISASLLIGSSLISTTNMKPMVLDIPLFGILGFMASASLSIWLLVGIIRRWRKDRLKR